MILFCCLNHAIFFLYLHYSKSNQNCKYLPSRIMSSFYLILLPKNQLTLGKSPSYKLTSTLRNPRESENTLTLSDTNPIRAASDSSRFDNKIKQYLQQSVVGRRENLNVQQPSLKSRTILTNRVCIAKMYRTTAMSISGIESLCFSRE